MTHPPGNSLDGDQGKRVIDQGADLTEGLRHLRQRIADEMTYNEAKGQSAYRMGMQDGLHFVLAALDALLSEHTTD
jgi:hypothetical protein